MFSSLRLAAAWSRRGRGAMGSLHSRFVLSKTENELVSITSRPVFPVARRTPNDKMPWFFVVHGCVFGYLLLEAWENENKRHIERQGLFKLTRHGEKHANLQIHTGYVEDVEEFDDRSLWGPGIYCCKEEDIPLWLDLYDWMWIRSVKIPEGAKFIRGEIKCKASACVFGPRISIRDWLSERPELWDRAVQSCVKNLRFIKEPTTELVMAAQRKHSIFEVLRFVDSQTEDMCIRLCDMNPWNLIHVKVQTPAICLAAVNRDDRVLMYVQPQLKTDAICEAACSAIPVRTSYYWNKELN
jgi:hypothetical protein